MRPVTGLRRVWPKASAPHALIANGETVPLAGATIGGLAPDAALLPVARGAKAAAGGPSPLLRAPRHAGLVSVIDGGATKYAGRNGPQRSVFAQ